MLINILKSKLFQIHAYLVYWSTNFIKLLATAVEILQCVVVLYFTFNYTYVLCTLYLYNILILYAIDNSYEPTKIMCNGYSIIVS